MTASSDTRMPLPSEMPRERLMREGRAALTDEELLALFLRTGIVGCNVLELASRLKRETGSLSALAGLEAQEIQSLGKGIGMAKAATLAAAFELGRRAVQEVTSKRELIGARDVYDYLAPEMHALRQETLVLLLLDVRRQLIAKRIIGTGSLSRVITHPRDIFREALRFNAFRIILAHNHPSGDVHPSAADMELTNTVNRAGSVMCIPLEDHIIIGHSQRKGACPYYSFRENGMLKIAP